MKNKINVYKCPDGHETVTIDADEGVTPYSIKCRAIGCKKMALSTVYTCSQDLQPQFEWYRETDLTRLTVQDKFHHDNGGLFLRPINILNK